MKPGSLEGILTSDNGGAISLSLTIEDLDDPFGGTPPAGEFVELRLDGINDGSGTILAWEVEARVRDWRADAKGNWRGGRPKRAAPLLSRTL